MIQTNQITTGWWSHILPTITLKHVNSPSSHLSPGSCQPQENATHSYAPSCAQRSHRKRLRAPIRVSQARTVPSCKRNIQITNKIRCRWCQNYSASSCFSIYVYIFGYCLDTLLNISGECSKNFGPLSSRLHMDPNLSNWKQEIQTPLLGFHVAIRLESFPPRRNHDLVERNNLKIFATNLRLCENRLLL